MTPLEKIEWIVGVMKDPETSRTAVVVGVYLMDCQNHKTGQLNPSANAIQKNTGLSRQGCINAIKSLLDNRWLYVVNKGDGRGNRTDYRLIVKGTTNVPIKDAKRVQKETPFNSEKGTTNVPINEIKGTKNNTQRVQKTTSSDGHTYSNETVNRNSEILSSKKKITTENKIIKNPQEKITPSAKIKAAFTDEDSGIANWMFGCILAINPGHKKPNMDKWANTIRLIRVRDSRTHDEIVELFKWANGDNFWQGNILSPAKLREKWDTLKIQSKRNGNIGVNQHDLDNKQYTGTPEKDIAWMQDAAS